MTTEWAYVIVALCAAAIAAGFLWNAERARQQNERILNSARDAERQTLATLDHFIEANRRKP